MANYSKMTASRGAGLRTGWSFAVVRQTLGEWRRRIAARRALSKLDPHLLRDIGLSDVDARRESTRHFWQE